MIRSLFTIALLAFVTVHSIGQIEIPYPERIELIKKYLGDLEANKSFSGSILILKNNQEVLKEGFGMADKAKQVRFNSSTLSSIGSITKSFTAISILKLVEAKKIALTDNLKKFFPNVSSDKAFITIHQLLTHATGFAEFEEGDKGDFEKVDVNEFQKRAFNAKLTFAPGSKAIYSNVNFSLLAIIIEKITGVDSEKYLQSIFTPLGIKHIGYQYPTQAGQQIAIGYQNGKVWGTHQDHYKSAGGGPYWNLKGNGGLEASMDELSMWLQALNNNKVLSKNTMELMYKGHVLEDGTNGFYSFGYGCNISKSGRGTKVIDNGGSNGVYFARIVQFPEEGVTIAMATNESSMNTNMVLPNVIQLLYKGKIEAQAQKHKFEYPKAEKIYKLIADKGYQNLEVNLKQADIEVQDDIILLEVGELLRAEGKVNEGIALYEYYIKTFPQIVVAQNDLADLYLTNNQNEKAIKCYKEALRLRPGNPRATEALNRLGAK